jgi:hypothetical protein
MGALLLMRWFLSSTGSEASIFTTWEMHLSIARREAHAWIKYKLFQALKVGLAMNEAPTLWSSEYI